MENLFQYWSYQYYTAPLLIAAVVYCLIILVRRGNPIEPHRFHWFAISMLILWITNSVLFIVFYKTPYQPAIQQTFRYMDLLFLTVETLVFSHFYYHRLFSKRLKHSIVAANLIFMTGSTVIIVTSSVSDLQQIVRLRGWLLAAESVFFILLGIAYFITLFRESILRNLTDIPECWIATAITLLMLVSIPVAIGEILFFKTYRLWSGFYAIYYLLYTIFFLMVARACYCKNTAYGVSTRKSKPANTIPPLN